MSALLPLLVDDPAYCPFIHLDYSPTKAGDEIVSGNEFLETTVTSLKYALGRANHDGRSWQKEFSSEKQLA